MQTKGFKLQYIESFRHQNNSRNKGIQHVTKTLKL